MRARNILFICVICILLCGPLLLLGFQSASSLELPAWATSEEARYLAGGSASTNIQEKLNLASIKEGDLQTAVETEVANHVPLKAATLLGRSALHRVAIGVSNTLFGWDVLPTYYGSRYSHILDGEAVIWNAPRASSDFDASIRNFANELRTYVEDHQDDDIEYLVYLVGGQAYSSTNPSAELTGNPCIYEDVEEVMREEISGVDNLTLLGSRYDDVASYYEDFLKTDHHWGATGYRKAYEEICRAVDLPITDLGDLVAIDEYSGATARSALSSLTEMVYDWDYDYSNLRVLDDEGEPESDVSHRFYEERNALDRKYNLYDRYFMDLKNCSIAGGTGDRRVLLVTDSYGDALVRPLASSCELLVTQHTLHSGSIDYPSLSECIEENDIDTVIFVAFPWDYNTFLQRNPDFFD